jgi:uncharacterized protein YsxB (DUF464 family)
MTRCVADKGYEKNGNLSIYLSAFGHANYGERGKDIVCAAVSALCTALANTLLQYGVPKVAIRVNEGEFFVHASIAKNQALCEGAFDTAYMGLSMLAEQYPDNIFMASGVLH